MNHSVEDIEKRLAMHEPWSPWVSELHWLLQQLRQTQLQREAMKEQLRAQLLYREVMEGLPRGSLVRTLD